MTEHVQHPTVFDTDTQYLGSTYAKALLAVTEKRGVTDEVLEQLRSVIEDVLNKLPDFDAVLAAPRVPLEDKQRLLDQAFGGKMQRDLLNFLKVVARHGRLNTLRAIFAEYLKQYNQLRGRVEVAVETALPLSDALREEIVSRLRQALQADVQLHAKVNPDIVGGLVIRVGDTVFDGSVLNQLQRFQESAMARTRRALRDSLDRFARAE